MELVYMTVSKTVGRKALRVRIPPLAPLSRSESDPEATLDNATEGSVVVAEGP